MAPPPATAKLSAEPPSAAISDTKPAAAFAFPGSEKAPKKAANAEAAEAALVQEEFEISGLFRDEEEAGEGEEEEEEEGEEEEEVWQNTEGERDERNLESGSE